MKYPSRPSPNSQAVGAALLQQGGGAAAAPTAGPTPAEPSYAPGQSGPDVLTPAAMRAQGARQMGGPGQIDDNHTDSQDGGAHSTNAINVAVGEALTRVGGGNMVNRSPFKPRATNIAQLMHLGLSEIEARLLSETGGA